MKMWKSLINNSRKKDILYIVKSYLKLEPCGYCGKEVDPEAICFKCFSKNKKTGFQSNITSAFYSVLKPFRKKNKYLAIRTELRTINKAMDRAIYEMDVAYVEELQEEKYRLIESI